MNRNPFLFLLIILIGISLNSFGQTDSLSVEKEKTRGAFKGFVGGLYERSSVDPGYTNSFGLQVAVILKNQIQLGFYGVSYTSNNYRKRLIFPSAYQMNYKHAGLSLGYRTYLEKDYEFFIESKMGLGEVKWDLMEAGSAFLSDKFILYQLQAGLDYMLAEILALSPFIGYRWMTGLKITGLENQSFNGLYYGVTLKVGKFK